MHYFNISRTYKFMENNELGVFGFMSAWAGYSFADANNGINTVATTIATVGGAVLVVLNVYKTYKTIDKEETESDDK